MTESRLMNITMATSKMDKDGEIIFLRKKLAIPDCVQSDYIPYFSHAVQVYTYNIGIKVVQGEMYKLECTDTSNYDDTEIESHNKKVDYWNAYMRAFKARVDAYFNSLTPDLKNMIANDVFAKTYTSVQLEYYSYTTIEEDNGNKKAVKKLTKDIFPSILENGNTVKWAVKNIENVLSDVNVSKKDREEAMKPLRDKLAELYPNNGIYKEIYKNPSFNKMSKRYFDAFLHSTRKDAKQKLDLKNPIVLTQNLAFVGLAWLKVIDIKDFEIEQDLVSVSLVKLPKPEAVNN